MIMKDSWGEWEWRVVWGWWGAVRAEGAGRAGLR